MELRYLRYFASVVEHGSITAAANQLRVAQPALSRQLRLLEHEIGFSLMERTSRGVLLTEAGAEFAKDAQRILADVARSIERVRALSRGDAGTLHIGYAPSPTAEILPLALEALKRRAPQVEVKLHDLGGDELLAGLLDGTVHLALMVDPGSLLPRNVVFRPVRQYKQCVAVPAKHRFARCRKVKLEQVAAEPLVVYDRREYKEYFTTVQEILRPVTSSPKIAGEVDGLTSLISAVLSGRGVALVPHVAQRLAGNQLKFVPLTPEPAPTSVGYAHRTDVPLSPIARRLTAALKQL